MLNFLKAAVAAAALAAAAPAAAQAPVPTGFDASRAGTLAERLVICDLAAYLGTAPDPNATRVYVRRDNHWFEPLIPPFISRGGFWYDEDLERAYRRYRAAGQITPDQLHQAQDVYSRAMQEAFERPSLRQQRFLQDQAPFCQTLARNAPR